MSSKKTFTVDEQFIKDAYKEAPAEWKTKLEKRFPELFDDGIFKFEDEYVVNDRESGDSPLFIGDGLAPNGLEKKCLMVRKGFKVEVQEQRGYQVLVFKKK